MSPNQNQSPVKMVVSDNFYEILLTKRAQTNERLALEGLPPRTDELWYISESQARAQAEAQAIQRAAQNAPAVLPRPGWAVRSLLKTRRESIDGFERHSRKCRLCRHPRLEEIENAYLNWHSAYDICRVFQVDDPDALYRHARAARLDATRRGNVRHVVEHFIEQAHNVKITSSAVLRSIRALSCLDDKGRWTDLPKTHILLRATEPTSTERSTPDPVVTSTAAVASSLSTERSEPSRENVNGLPENESDAGGFPSTEHSEPKHRKGTPSGVPTGRAPSGVLTPQVSTSVNRQIGGPVPSAERGEPQNEGAAPVTCPPPLPSNRVSMGN